MDVLALVIAVIALVVAVSAFKRTGGIGNLKDRVQTLSSSTDAMRDRTADALNRLEHLVRGKERSKLDEPVPPPPRADTG